MVSKASAQHKASKNSGKETLVGWCEHEEEQNSGASLEDLKDEKDSGKGGTKSDGVNSTGSQQITACLFMGEGMDFWLKNTVVWGRKGNNIEQGSQDLEGQLEESELTAMDSWKQAWSSEWMSATLLVMF